jgi:uncharacterized protein with HEPN domain
MPYKDRQYAVTGVHILATYGVVCGYAEVIHGQTPRTWQERIQDMLAAIAEIETFIAGLNRDQFLADAKTLKAVVADLTIIGEAARYVPHAIVQGHPEVPWALMTGMRHRIVHGYYQVDPVMVWDTCQNDLAPLVPPLQQLLGQNP